MKKGMTVFLILFCSLATRTSWDADVWTQSLDKVSSMMTLIEQDHFEDKDFEELAYGTIRGMLQTLDPHSYFLEPKDFSRLNEDYKGKYSGLGILIQKQEDRLVVISPLEGTPAHRLGIRPGDIISHIEGQSTKPITSREAVQKLRGVKGTQVTITIVRDGMEPFDLAITRAEIPLHSVPYAFMIRGDVGYIFIRNFAETTTREFREKMRFLKGRGMGKLILDLRGNGGGTFAQSVEISDEFLPRGSLIVSIKGRRGYYSRDIRADVNNQHEDIPLVILINRGSASAPEIVSGAVKDNDRGLIVGEASWGKGLVQTVFRLAPDTAVALTTAKYYTPSGRSIQRDYAHVEDYWMGKAVPEEQREVRYTPSGRKVLGQGGITPDYKVGFDLQDITARLLLKGAFFTYATRFAEKKTPLSKTMILPEEAAGKDAAGRGEVIDQEFQVDTRMVSDFKSYLRESSIAYDGQEFEDALAEIKRELEREIFSALWGIEAGIRVYRKSDPVVLKALEVFPQAVALLQNSQAS